MPSPPPSPKPSSSPKSPGRPKRPFARRAPGIFKKAATGETRNSPMTNPNIIFWLGMGLIIASGFSSGRLPSIFSDAWNMGSSGTKDSPADWFTKIKITGSQFLFIFIITLMSRAIPPIARVWLIILVGIWILWLIKNPQIVALLNWTSVGATNQQSYNALVSQLAQGTKTV